MTMTPRRLIVCADDYALAPGVSLGIRELAEAGRISATGAMVTMPGWAVEAPALKALDGKIAVGLHLTLTDQAPLGPMPELAPGGKLPPVGRLLRRALSGKVPELEVAAEIERQLNAFIAHWGAPPDFIDGHQHVHVLPGVRGAVLALFGRRLDPRTCWLRDCSDNPRAILRRGKPGKAALIAGLSLGLGAAARRAGIATNRGFSGFYGGSFAQALPGLLEAAVDGHLLMVHPGHVDEALRLVDSLVEPRAAEWAALMAPDFPKVLADKGFSLTGVGQSWQTPAP